MSTPGFEEKPTPTQVTGGGPSDGTNEPLGHGCPFDFGFLSCLGRHPVSRRTLVRPLDDTLPCHVGKERLWNHSGNVSEPKVQWLTGYGIG